MSLNPAHTRKYTPVLILGATVALSACDNDTGVVEIAWAFVDRDGDPIYPGGVFSIDDERDSCGLPGRIGTDASAYDLRMELEICNPECAGGCDDPSCHVIERERYACDISRASLPRVPASDAAYRVTARAVITAAELASECEQPLPTCIAVPAPRERVVTAGLVTDLQVYQVVVDVDTDSNFDNALDLEACGCA